MKISKTLRKPANWQDFESLCLLLWREEWQSDDLKKNGRNGQVQKGVDISGHRQDENEYSGIQCKCKPGNASLTKSEINLEIENAKLFKPALKRLVFATTSDKDVAIEEYIRIKDDENRKCGLFAIDIKSWQDIVDMLERNKPVLNTYMDIVAEDYAIDISFYDGDKETIIRPKFARIYHMEREQREFSQSFSEPPKENMLDYLLGGVSSQLNMYEKLAKTIVPPVASTIKVVKGHIETNYAYCPLKFLVMNQGKSPIDDFKIKFAFDNKQVLFTGNNIDKKNSFPEISLSYYIPNISMENGVGVFMYGNSLIPADSAISDEFYVHFPDDADEVNVNWSLLSRQYSTSGQLRIKVEKEFVDDVRYDNINVGTTTIEDYIEKEDITD